jgi:cardiolipin synthase
MARWPELALFFSAFLDTALVGIPTGPLVALSSYARPDRAWAFLLVGALGSGLGALVPYAAGRLAGDWALQRWPKAAEYEKRFTRHRFATVLLGSALPVPVKPFMAAAGIFHAPAVLVLVAAIAGRLLRYAAETLLVLWLGPSIVATVAVSPWMVAATVVLTLAILAWAFGVRPWQRRRRARRKPLGAVLRQPLDLPHSLQLLFGARPFSASSLELFTEGSSFFAAELEAIRQAQQSIELESYIFHDDVAGRTYLEAFTERARQGVEVRLLLDAAGNWHVPKSFFAPLVAAGGRVHFFRSLRPRRFWWAAYRNHRDVLVVDGRVAFAGGAGISDHWLGAEGKPPWRDCVVRVEGDAVALLQGVFRRAWLERTRELVPGNAPAAAAAPGSAGGLVMESKPMADSPAPAYLALQTLFSTLQTGVDIITPYFVPPPALRAMLARMAAAGIRVRMVLPGDNSDHLITRGIARMRYGELLRAGVEVYEYKPTMHHGKLLIADGRWTCFGSVNLDYRSLFRNEELLVLSPDARLARTAEQHFKSVLAESRRVALADWKQRRLSDRLAGGFALMIEHQL